MTTESTSTLIKSSTLLSRLGTSRLLRILATRDARQEYDVIMNHYAYRPFTEKEMKKVLFWVLHGANLSFETRGHSLVERIFSLQWHVLSFHNQNQNHSSLKSFDSKQAITNTKTSDLTHSTQSVTAYFFEHIPTSSHAEMATHLFLSLKPTETTHGERLEEMLLKYGAKPIPTFIHRIEALSAQIKSFEEKYEKAKERENHSERIKWDKLRYTSQVQLNYSREMIVSSFLAIKRAGLKSQFSQQFLTWKKPEQDWVLNRKNVWSWILGEDYFNHLQILFEKFSLEQAISISNPEKKILVPKKRL